MREAWDSCATSATPGHAVTCRPKRRRYRRRSDDGGEPDGSAVTMLATGCDGVLGGLETLQMDVVDRRCTGAEIGRPEPAVGIRHVMIDWGSTKACIASRSTLLTSGRLIYPASKLMIKTEDNTEVSRQTCDLNHAAQTKWIKYGRDGIGRQSIAGSATFMCVLYAPLLLSRTHNYSTLEFAVSCN